MGSMLESFGESAVESAIQFFIFGCFRYLKDQVRWQTGMKEELQSLREKYPKIRKAVSDYNKEQIEDSDFNHWYWQLRDAVDEADDVFDEFEYEKLEKEVCKNKTVRKVRSRIVKICKRALKIDSKLKRLLEALQKCDKIQRQEVDTFLDVLNKKKQQLVRKSNPKPDRFVGRKEEIELLGKWLSDSYHQPKSDGYYDPYRNISLLSVVGLGGMGKTTLLQHVFLSESMTRDYVKIWVPVSHDFKAETVITDILKWLHITPQSKELFLLQADLEAKLEAKGTKKFLLVLDEIWEDDGSKWTNVLDSLSHGKLGSKILVTTRMNSVALMFSKKIKNSKEPLELKGLDKGTCLSLFKEHAFDGLESPSDELIPIAENIVEKLSRCPLAINVISNILKFKLDESSWKEVFKTNIGNVRPYNHDLMDIFKMSYRYLPEYLQNCFAFCCIFPPKHEFDRDDLVRMWIALGFIQSQNNPEEIGGRYFDSLVENSFFEISINDDDAVVYKVDNLLHELAQSIFRHEYFIAVDDELAEIPKTTRHLSINTCDLATLEGIGEFIKASKKEGESEILRSIGECIQVFQKEGKFKNLRSVFLSYNADHEIDENFIHVLFKIFKASKSIRVLVIYHPILEKIPAKINRLIHLRHLKLHCENSRLHVLRHLNHERDQLPESISHLHHLQFIIFKERLV